MLQLEAVLGQERKGPGALLLGLRKLDGCGREMLRDGVGNFSRQLYFQVLTCITHKKHYLKKQLR